MANLITIVRQRRVADRVGGVVRPTTTPAVLCGFFRKQRESIEGSRYTQNQLCPEKSAAERRVEQSMTSVDSVWPSFAPIWVCGLHGADLQVVPAGRHL